MTEAKTATTGGIDFEKASRSFQNTFGTNKILFKAEIAVDYAYCDSLFEAGILTRLESEKIKTALQTILKRADFDRNYFENHVYRNLSEFIEEKLVQLAGEVGGKIKIGRSARDLNSTVLRFWLRQQIQKISGRIRSLQKKIIRAAVENPVQTIFIRDGFRPAQPVLFAHWCHGYFESFARDRERFDEVWRRTNTLPLGSGSGGGTALEFDREELARKLGFEGISVNSFDAVRDRDFIYEFLNQTSILTRHLLQLADDLVFYSAEPNEFFEIAENHKNLLETVRGHANRTIALAGAENSNVGINPFESNEIIFGAVENSEKSLVIFEEILSALKLNRQKQKALQGARIFEKKEIFEYFVQRGVCCEEAKDASEKISELFWSGEFSEKTKNSNREFCENENFQASRLLEKLKEISPRVGEDFLENFEIETILKQKNQIGGTSPERVSEAVEEARAGLEFEE